MNFLSIEYFVAVAEELNITKAAERLYISQQSLSNSIIRLEKSLGVQLFNRTHSMSLTYAGNRLLKYARQLLDLKARMISEMDDISDSRRTELRIGVSHTRGRAILPDLLPAFSATHPHVEITLVEGNSESLEQKLAHGMIDLLFGFLPIMIEGVETTELLKERLFLVVPKRFSDEIFGQKADFMRGKFSESGDLSAFKDFPMVMLKSGNRIRNIMDSMFSQEEINPNIVLETDNIETALALSCKGMGITVYPELFLNSLAGEVDLSHDKVDFFPLKYDGSMCILAIGYSQKRYLSTPMKAFIELAQTVLGKGNLLQ